MRTEFFRTESGKTLNFELHDDYFVVVYDGVREKQPYFTKSAWDVTVRKCGYKLIERV